MNEDKIPITDESVIDDTLYDSQRLQEYPTGIPKKIKKNLALAVIEQSNCIILSQSLTPLQISQILENNTRIIEFIKSDHYASLFAGILGGRK